MAVFPRPHEFFRESSEPIFIPVLVRMMHKVLKINKLREFASEV